ncbi:MAG TPA: tetratricopeptide repeat protein [Methanospirillum sp.]|nr:tetratricopeptide repeat protein [Methanospirillum sp.]
MHKHPLFLLLALILLIIPGTTTAAPAPLSLAEASYGAGDFTGAIRWYDEILAHNPMDPDAFSGKLRSLGALGRWDEVLTLITAADPDVASRSDLVVLAAEGNVKTGKYQEALDLLNTNPGIPAVDTILIQAEALVGLGRDEEALRLINENSTGSSDPRRALLTGEIFLDRGNLTAALPYLEEAYISLPTEPNASFSLGKAMASLGYHEEALLVISDTPGAMNEDPARWSMIAYLKNRQGDYPGAIVALDRAIALTPEDPDLINAKAYTLSLAGQISEARGLAEDALKKNPDDAATMDTLGTILLAGKQYDEAAEWFEKAYRELYYDPEVITHLADAYAGLDRITEAQDLYPLAIRADPSYGPAYKGYAGVLIKLERYPEAALALNEAFRYYPGDPDLIHWEEQSDDILLARYLKNAEKHT